MKSASKVLVTWAKDNGLVVNPTRTELMLFPSKYKVLDFPLPWLEGEVLKHSQETEYLGIIRDSKLL